MTELVKLDEELCNIDSPYGSYSLTHSGGRYYYEAPEKSDFNICDIAHALSQEPRFSGSCCVPYTVADHLIIGSYEIDQKFAYDYLMHDAIEAYLKDIPRPLKKLLPEYQKLEHLGQVALAAQFEFNYPFGGEVKEIDNLMVATEAHYLCGSPAWCKTLPKLSRNVFPVTNSPMATKMLFLERFAQLAPEHLR